MSSLYVRELVRSWCADKRMALPFVDTVNVEVRPQFAQWSTLSFVTSITQRTTYCGDVEERGSFDFIALGTPGVGDSQLFEACEHDVAQLLAQADPDGRLTLVRASAPDDFLQGGSVPWYTVSQTIEYVYQQLPVPLVSPT